MCNKQIGKGLENWNEWKRSTAESGVYTTGQCIAEFVDNAVDGTVSHRKYIMFLSQDYAERAIICVAV